jgi:two-component system, cell cycle response regulator DivK
VITALFGPNGEIKGFSKIARDVTERQLAEERFRGLLEGLDVRTALSAEEALTVLESFTPDLILMDLQLPGIDGLQLTPQLKADPNRRHITVLAVTAYAMKGDMEKALAAGCDGYISKPFDPPMLCSLVQHHLTSKRSSPSI